MPEANQSVAADRPDQAPAGAAGTNPMTFPEPNLEMNMNRNIAIAILAAAAAAATGNAFADDITIDTTPFVSSRSRTEVQTELAQYKQSGVNPWSISYHQLRAFQGAKTREQVTGEYITARDRVAAFTGEDSGSAYLARSRAVVAGTTLAGQPQRAV